PPGLQILVDGAVINTPNASSQSSDGVTCAPDYTRLPPGAPNGFQPLCLGQFDFLPGSKHTLGAPVTPLDTKNKYWVFHVLGNGRRENSVYVVPATTAVPDTMTVGCVAGWHVSILTSPGRMKVMVDGRDNWPSYNFIWGQGDTHHIAGETPQKDA